VKPASIAPRPAIVRFLVLLAAAVLCAQETPVFRTDVSQVHVDAEVLGADGRTIDGLTLDDFRVFDQNKEQPIVHFSAEQELLDLILLFDISGSMQIKVQRVAQAARLGLQELKPGDRVAVMVFNSRSREIAPFTDDLAAVEGTVQNDVLGLRFGGGTLIQQAVDDAALRFRHEPHTQRRRAVLIITDNIGRRTQSESSVVEDFWESDAILSGLLLKDRLEQVRLYTSPIQLAISAGMKGIATKTGGDSIDGDDPGSAFQEAMHRIRARYSLYYAQPAGKPGSNRTIRVELSHEAAARYPKARIRARTGYIVPK
jgi:VWFA-related protein